MAIGLLLWLALKASPGKGFPGLPKGDFPLKLVKVTRFRSCSLLCTAPRLVMSSKVPALITELRTGPTKVTKGCAKRGWRQSSWFLLTSGDFRPFLAYFFFRGFWKANPRVDVRLVTVFDFFRGRNTGTFLFSTKVLVNRMLLHVTSFFVCDLL